MSSEILSVSEKMTRQFFQQKNTYRDLSSIQSSLAKSSLFQAIFLFLETVQRRKHISEQFSENPQEEQSNTSNNAQATSDKGSRCQTVRRK